MPIHLVKLSVGSQTVEDLAAWQKTRLAQQKGTASKPRLVHTTHQTPKRQDELLDGGSIYWVIKGLIQVRQKLIGFDEGQKGDGRKCCLLVLDPKLVPVRSMPRRAFQGWRYLKDDDVPADITGDAKDDTAQMPLKMRRDLAELGLL